MPSTAPEGGRPRARKGRRGRTSGCAQKLSGVRMRSRIQTPAGLRRRCRRTGRLPQVPVVKTAPERKSSEKFQFTQLIFLLAIRSRYRWAMVKSFGAVAGVVLGAELGDEERQPVGGPGEGVVVQVAVRGGVEVEDVHQVAAVDRVGHDRVDPTAVAGDAERGPVRGADQDDGLRGPGCGSPG